MEENNKMCSEDVEIKENDCKLTDEELETVAGGVNHDVEPDKDPAVLQDEGDFISPTIHFY